ncbi:MAG: InlB B-repeat-containing protein [Paludibacteraceae bacterium]|nr:InlB B-repeat-containing protein [Paludibacteraceae bacterium]
MKTFANIQKEIISHLKSSARSAQGVLCSLGLVVTLLLVGTGNVWATDDTYDFKTSGVTKVSGPNAGNMTTSSGNVVLKSKTGNTTDSWTIVFTGNTAYGYGSGTGVYIGTGSRELHATLTSKSYTNVTQVDIVSSTSNTSVTLAVTVGATSFGSKTATSGNTKTQSYTHAAATGAVTISVESTTKTQFKIEKIIITTSAGASKTYHEWNGSSAFTTSSGGATLKEVPSLCDWAIEPYGWCSEENYASSDYPTDKIWFKDASWPAGKTDLYALYRVGSSPYYYSTKPTIYTITYNLTNASKDDEYSYSCMSDMVDVLGTSNFYGYFKPATGYILDESSISITMGGSPVSSSNYSWDPEYSYAGYDYTAELYMENITGNVVVTVTGKTCTPLTAPTGLTLSTDHQGTAGKTRFGWNSVSGATGYKVTVTKGGVSASVTTASDRYYYITTFPDGDYTWTVQALGDGSTYCAEGTAANGTPFSYCHKDVSGVTPTVNAATSITTTGATANWTAVSDADHYTIKVYEGTNASGTLRKTYSDVTGTSQAITGLTAGAATTYYIEVQAHDACGHNSSKAGVTFTTLAAHYTITYNKDAYSSGDQIAAGDKTHGVNFTLTSSVYTRDGYRQDGWATSSGGPKVYNIGDTYTGNANLNLYPHWAEITYTNYRTTCEAPKTLDYITIDTDPTKLIYLVGETVNTAGAVVTAHYTDDTSSDVTASVTWTAPSGALSAGLDQALTASYTLGGVTRTATHNVVDVYAVTLLKKDETGATISGELSDAPAVSLTSVNHLTAAETGNQYTFWKWEVSNGSLSSTSSLTPTIDAVTGAITVTAIYYKPITVTWSVNGSVYSGPSIHSHGWNTIYPSDPTPASVGCEGKVFIGWSRTPDYRSDDTAPTDMVESGEALTKDELFYAVFADKESEGTAPEWTKTALGSVTAGTYLICTTNGKPFNGTMSSGHGQPTGSAFSSANWALNVFNEDAPIGAQEITFSTNGSGWKMYVEGSGYLYATKASSGGFSYQADAGEEYWYESSSAWRYSKNYSGNYAYLRVYSSTFRTYNSSTGGDAGIVLLKKTAAGSPAVYSDYTTSCTCKGFSFHTGSGTDDAVKTTNTRTCFEQVDASTTWKIDDYVIPSDAKFFVGWQDEFKSSGLGTSSRSAVTAFNADEAMYFEYTKNYGAGYRPSVGNAEGAIGTLRIWSDNDWNNCHVGFDPNGYIFKLGSTYYTMSNSATLDGARYKETEVITLTSSDISGQFQVNIAAVAPNVSTGVASRYTESKNLTTMGVKSGAGDNWRGTSINNAADANTKGFFRIDKGEGGATNWNAHWVPCYELTFDLKGGTGTIVTTPEYVSVEAASKVVTIPTTAPTKSGYRFMGWSDADDNTVEYAAGSTHNVTLSGNKTVYAVWAQEYTVTYDANGGTTSCSEPTHIAGETVTVCATEPTRDCSTFLGWLGDNGIGTKAASATFTMPAANVTLTAQWNTTQYAITYKDQGDVTYTGSNIGSLPANHTCGSATVLPNGVKEGYRFDGWFTASACTGDPITSIASDAVGPFTLYAKWTAAYTFTFSKNGVVDGTLTLGQVEGGNVIMPNTTVDCGLWTTFEGWVIGDVAETTTEPTTIYKPGDIYVAGSSNQEFKAVYSKHEGDATVSYHKVTSGLMSGTYIMVSSEVSSNKYVYTGQNSGSGTTDYGTVTTVTESDGVVTSANLPSGAKEVTVRVGRGGSISNKFAMQIPSTKYLSATSGNYLNSDIASGDVADAYVWKLDNGTDSYGASGKEKTGAAGALRSTEQTTRVIQYNSSRFACYTNSQANYVFLYRKRVAGTTYYTTAPGSCEVPTEITVSYNDNKANAGDQTISGMPSGTTLTFTDYPNFASYSVGAAPTDPTGYHFAGWNTSADGGGDDYAAGASVTTFGYTETITLYAQWERVYTVTLHDQGSTDTRTQASAGANVTLPGGTPCGGSFTFVGWTASALDLAGDVACPTIVSGAGAWGDDELTDDIDLYAVYSKSQTTCTEFATGDVSGAYYIYYDASNYAVASPTGTSYSIASSGDKQVFYIAYSHVKNGYTIRTPEGYLGWNYDGSSMTKGNSTPYYWTLGGSANNWKFTPAVGTKELKCTSSNLGLYASGTSGKIYSFTKASSTLYYSVTNCTGSYTMTFHDGGGTISGTPTTPSGASWNSGTHVLSALEDCDKITTFPTASYGGWDFLGWSTEDFSNSGRHTTDHLDENGSTDEPYSDILYSTDGNNYTILGSNVDLYPVFTKFPDNEPFNTESGGDYYIYYLKPGSNDGYGGLVRSYAGEYSSDIRYLETTSCAEATEFTFTKDGDVWHIYDKTKDKYVAGVSGGDNLVHRADLSGDYDDWTISIVSGNQFNASCQSGDRRYISYSNVANRFMDYDVVSSPGVYEKVYLGSCTERIFSSEPSPVPTITLTGEPYVTSSAGERVRATATMTLTGAHLSTAPVSATRIKLSGANLKFAKTAAENPVTDLYVDLVSGSVTQTIYVYYTPVATEDGIENIIVTAQAYNYTTPKDVTTTGVVHARHLPADFVIAAKWEGKWYALPNTCAGEGSNTAGVLIEVNDANAPTAATAAPHTAKWGMRQTKKGSRSDGSYNDRLVFTERTTAVVNNQKTLYNYNQAEVFTSATYENYNNTNPERYEWIPVTTDFGDYELTNANDASHHLILRNSDGLFVAQNSDKSYDGKVRLLPATFYEEAPVQIVEWKANSVVVMYTGTETSATTKVGTNSASSAQTLSTHKLTHGIYELTTGPSMSIGTNTNKNLLLTFGSTKKVFEIPVIITGSTNASSGYDKQDVIITKTGKLTAQSTKYSYRNIYVYGGGKLKIASGMSLGVNNIILRAGGITTSGIGSSPSATYEYIYPQVELRGSLSSTKTNIKYEYITDYDHWYHLVLPFDGTLSSITYPTEYYGDNVAAGNKGSWIIKRYAGEVRATGNYDAWKDIETEGATSVTAGHGYIYWGAPKKVTIGGSKQRQAWGIQRITMPVTASATMEAENANKVVGGLGSYSGVSGNSGQDNDQGWNLIGDPYLTNITNLSGTGMHTCKLVEVLDANDNWTGRWEWNDETSIRYLTIPDHHFDNYTAKTIPVAVAAGDLNTGHTFFVQIAGEATGVTFEQANRASLMPALYAKVEESVDIETGVVLSDETKHDEVNFWIKDGKTAEYEYNADYPKTPNSSNFNLYGVHSHGDLSWIAISPEIAEGSMAIGYQVPTAGEYRLSLSETYVSDKIEQLLVTDHAMNPEVTTNLLMEDYLFQVNQAETNNERFTVSIKIKSGTNTATDIDDIRDVSDQPKKFLYRDKMYILRGGKIYDATGKQVREINK